MSYLERYFKLFLVKYNIWGWEYSKRVERMELDFAFPGFKIDVELDGGHHRNKIDKKRDKHLIKKHGWTVVRFKNKHVLRHPTRCIRFLKLIINSELWRCKSPDWTHHRFPYSSAPGYTCIPKCFNAIPKKYRKVEKEF